MDEKHYAEEEVCWAVFRIFDKDCIGKIDQNELHAVLTDESDELMGVALGAAAVKNVLVDVDTDGDGTVDFDEFMNIRTI